MTIFPVLALMKWASWLRGVATCSPPGPGSCGCYPRMAASLAQTVRCFLTRAAWGHARIADAQVMHTGRHVELHIMRRLHARFVRERGLSIEQRALHASRGGQEHTRSKDAPAAGQREIDRTLLCVLLITVRHVAERGSVARRHLRTLHAGGRPARRDLGRAVCAIRVQHA